MSKNSKCAKKKLPDHLDLDLPDDPDFQSIPPKLSVQEMILECEKLLPYWNKRRFVDNLALPGPVAENFVL